MTILHTEQLVPSGSMASAPPKLQLYTNTNGTMGSSVGSPISGTVDGTYTSKWTFDVTSVAVGTYFAQIQDVSVPNAPPFEVRKTATQFYETVPYARPTASAIDGICNVLFTVLDNAGDPIEKASVYATLEPNATVSGALVTSSVTSGQTAANGTKTLQLIQFGEFTAGGQYQLRVTDRSGKLIWKRRVEIPNTSSAIAEEIDEA